MIGKAKSCLGGTALANYVMQDAKGYELMRNGVVGDTPTEVLHQMKMIQDLNQRAKNKTFSLVLSPEKIEGNTLSDEKLRELTYDFLNDLGLDPKERQFVAFVHDEKEHKHIHIIMNRVDYDGKLLPDNHIGKKAQWSAHKIAKKHNLKSAKEKAYENMNKRKEQMNHLEALKNEIHNKHKWVMSKNPASVKVYMKMMEKLDLRVEPTIRKYGKIKGMRIIDIKTGMSFKASEVHRNMSLPNILKTGIPYDTSEEIVNETLSSFPEFKDLPYEQRESKYEDIAMASLFENIINIAQKASWDNNNSEDLETKKRKKRRKNIKR